ncbi:MAG: YicC/YloC family endoribonuclease [Bacteroidota bacterium]
MTGFARGEGRNEACTWTWELKSVNARGLEVRCRMPPGFEALEQGVRQRVAASLKRGNISAALSLTWSVGQQGVRINTDVLEQVLALIPQIESRLRESRPPGIDGLLALRGVIDVLDPTPTGEARAALEASLLAGLDPVLAALSEARRAEGGRLEAVLRDHLRRLADLCDRARRLASAQPAAIFARLSDQLAALLGQSPALTPERLAQEAALLAAKVDAREELDRLRAHHQAALALLDGGGPVGRQLDFLCQELNREANTLCAKSADIELTRVGLDLKATVEQVREQVQNIE